MPRIAPAPARCAVRRPRGFVAAGRRRRGRGGYCRQRPQLLADEAAALRREGVAAEEAAAEGLLHLPAEHGGALQQRRRGLVVERELRVGLEEEQLQPEDDGVQADDGLPVLIEDAQAHAARPQAHVGVPHARHAVHRRRAERESVRDVDLEGEPPAGVDARGELDGDLQLDGVPVLDAVDGRRCLRAREPRLREFLQVPLQPAREPKHDGAGWGRGDHGISRSPPRSRLRTHGDRVKNAHA
mmetsp:Transcript_34310/g.108153  ORF Transcript_34310/g.108153 Transcript_34310/m.108153 type:complete len:242 (-) Transcript_34310:135-860(-)